MTPRTVAGREAFDVAIIGAGPAGASAGVVAARAGARVVILEADEFPRDKPCGDALTPFAVEQLRKLDLLAVLAGGHLVTGIVLHGNQRDLLRTRWPSGGRVERRTGAVISRRLLDYNLALAAKHAGADLRTQTRVVELAVDACRPCVKVFYRRFDTSKVETLEARIAILAAGARSNKLSPAAEAAFAHVAVRGETDSALQDSRTLQFFTPNAMNLSGFSGYGWVFPMTSDGVVNTGIGAFVYDQSRSNVQLREHVAAFQNWLGTDSGVRPTGSLKLRGWTIPTNLAPPPDQPGILLAGDAAGVAHPLTGEGIGPALRSGRIAAAASMEFLADGDPSRAARRYRRRLWGSRVSAMAMIRASAPIQWKLTERLSAGSPARRDIEGAT